MNIFQKKKKHQQKFIQQLQFYSMRIYEYELTLFPHKTAVCHKNG